MKFLKNLSLAVTCILLLSTTVNAQDLKKLFSDSEAKLFYLGIDFSKAKLLDAGNPSDIRDNLYGKINYLIIQEPKKFDLEGAFKKTKILHDLGPVTKKYEKINLNDILSTNEADFNRFKESDITGIVKALDFKGENGASFTGEGVGLIFIMEAMKKQEKKGVAAIWVTFINMDTKKVLYTERIESKANTAIGFRNYWASTIKNLIDDIDDKKYKEWKAKFGG